MTSDHTHRAFNSKNLAPPKTLCKIDTPVPAPEPSTPSPQRHQTYYISDHSLHHTQRQKVRITNWVRVLPRRRYNEDDLFLARGEL